jgi:hypothetical protein
MHLLNFLDFSLFVVHEYEYFLLFVFFSTNAHNNFGEIINKSQKTLTPNVGEGIERTINIKRCNAQQFNIVLWPSY